MTSRETQVKVDGPGRRRPKEDENCWLEGEGRGQTGVEQNCWTDQDPPRVVESTEEEEEVRAETEERVEDLNTAIEADVELAEADEQLTN